MLKAWVNKNINGETMDDLKLFMLHYINMQEELTYKGKNQVWNFIKEGSESQIIYYLEKNACVSDEKAIIYEANQEYYLDESAGTFIAKDLLKGIFTEPFHNWKNYLIPQRAGIVTGARVGLVGGVMLAAIVATLSYAVYKNYFDKYEKKCKGTQGLEKTMCIARAKVAAKKEQYSRLGKGMNACAKTKDPDKCKTKLKKKMIKVKSEIQAAEQRTKK